jgi:uncharacterized protein
MKISRAALAFVPAFVLAAKLLLHCLPAHATSFDCNKGRSIPEQLICHQPALSSLDDQLGKLYWQARRNVANPRAFRADSDSKWAWREAHCSDEACLKSWYLGRIAELQQLLANLPHATPPGAPEDDPAAPVHPLTRDPERRALAQGAPVELNQPDTAAHVAEAEQADELTDKRKDKRTNRRSNANAANQTGAAASTLAMQCTAADPGIALHEQCATVLKEDARWQYPAHGGDWFCGVANLTQTSAAPVVEQ